MGKIINNAITSSFSGMFGDQLVFRRVGGQTIFARKGKNVKPASAAQEENRHKFAEVQLYTQTLAHRSRAARTLYYHGRT